MEVSLTNLLFRYLWNLDEAEDTLQEAFLRLWKNQDKVDWSRSEAMVFRIAINLACSKLRRRKLWQLTPFKDDLGTRNVDFTGEGEMNSGRELRVQEAIKGLPEKLRRVLLLNMYTEKSYAQIAAILQVPEGTVASRRNQGIAKIQDALRGDPS